MSASIEQKQIGELVLISFPLSQEPLAIQLTIHVNNFLLTFRSQGSVKIWRDILDNPEMLNNEDTPLFPRQIISYYGVENCRQWFTTVYNWKFDNNKVVNKQIEKVS